MKMIGLTGGIGMGKSAASEFLRQQGIMVIDTDAVAREVVEPGRPALEEIRQAFGNEVIGEDGRLRRDVVARLVFADGSKRNRLEAILHPRIREEWIGHAERWRSEGRKACVVVIPLLFETKAEDCFDSIICVACSSATQWARLRARGWDDDQIRKRLEAQWPIEKKTSLSHFVIWTEGSLEVHAEQLSRVWQKSGIS